MKSVIIIDHRPNALILSFNENSATADSMSFSSLSLSVALLTSTSTASALLVCLLPQFLPENDKTDH
jgi:hypothetical protein